MIKFFHFMLLSSCVSTFAFANSQIEKGNLDFERKNLIGLWHCQTSTPTLRYNTFVTYHANQTYSDTGTASIYHEGKWQSVQYEGRGQWAFKPNKVLTTLNYTANILDPSQLEETELQFINAYFSKVPFHFATMNRSNGKMLVLQYKDLHNHSSTLRCNKKRA